MSTGGASKAEIIPFKPEPGNTGGEKVDRLLNNNHQLFLSGKGWWFFDFTKKCCFGQYINLVCFIYEILFTIH